MWGLGPQASLLLPSDIGKRLHGGINRRLHRSGNLPFAKYLF